MTDLPEECSCPVPPSVRARPHHEAVCELDRANCPHTPVEVLERMYLPDTAVLAAICRRPDIPARLLGRCITPALAHLARDPGGALRDAWPVSLILDHPALTRALLRRIAAHDSLHPETLAAVASHQLADESLLPTLAVNLYWWTQIGARTDGRRALRAGFGDRASAAMRLVARCDTPDELAAELAAVAELGYDAVNIYGSVGSDWAGSEDELRDTVRALAAASAPSC